MAVLHGHECIIHTHQKDLVDKETGFRNQINTRGISIDVFD